MSDDPAPAAPSPPPPPRKRTLAPPPAAADVTPERNSMMSQKAGCSLIALVASIVALAIVLVGFPQYRVYSQRLSGEAALAEAQSSRQVAVLEARAKLESAKSLADAEVMRAEGAARANRILQNSLGGPEGYLRYLQIQALETSNAQLIYVPTEAGLPVTEANRLKPQPPVKE